MIVVVESQIELMRSCELKDVLNNLEMNDSKKNYIQNRLFSFKENKVFLKLTYKGYKILTRKTYKTLNVNVKGIMYVKKI